MPEAADTPSATIAGDDLFEPAGAISPSARPKPARAASRTRRRIDFPLPDRPDFTAVYRLYSADDLLYVGMSNNPLERFIEHRADKDWWPQVELYSIEWFDTRAEAEYAEEDAIKDEWPLYNIAHQPRGNGPLVLSSYVVGQLVDAMREAVECVTAELSDDQVKEAITAFRATFDPEMFPDASIHFREQRATAVDLVPLDLQSVIEALGAFRPPTGTSLRVPSVERTAA